MQLVEVSALSKSDLALVERINAAESVVDLGTTDLRLSADSYFEDCPRDKEGQCLPSGRSGETGEKKEKGSSKKEKTVTFYHGTTLPAAKDIMENGLKPLKPRSAGSESKKGYVYVTDAPYIAMMFAKTAILQIVMPASALASFQNDDNVPAPTKDSAFRAMMRKGAIPAKYVVGVSMKLKAGKTASPGSWSEEWGGGWSDFTPKDQIKKKSVRSEAGEPTYVQYAPYSGDVQDIVDFLSEEDESAQPALSGLVQNVVNEIVDGVEQILGESLLTADDLRLAARSHLRFVAESYFSDCPRDEGGRCLPSGEAGRTGESTGDYLRNNLINAPSQPIDNPTQAHIIDDRISNPLIGKSAVESIDVDKNAASILRASAIGFSSVMAEKNEEQRVAVFGDIMRGWDGKTEGERAEVFAELVSREMRTLRDLPLMHVTSEDAVTDILREGLKSNAEVGRELTVLHQKANELRDKASPEDQAEYEKLIEEINSTPRGQTYFPDRRVGLDRFVFMTQGQPLFSHGRVAIAIDNSILSDKATWASQNDIFSLHDVDEGEPFKTPYSEDTIDAYRKGITSGPAYLAALAADRVRSVARYPSAAEVPLMPFFEIKAPSVPPSAVKGVILSPSASEKVYKDLLKAGVPAEKIFMTPPGLYSDANEHEAMEVAMKTIQTGKVVAPKWPDPDEILIEASLSWLPGQFVPTMGELIKKVREAA